MKPALLDFAHKQTIGRVILTWLHAEQVGWGRRDTNRAYSIRDQCSSNCIHEPWGVLCTQELPLLPLHKARNSHIKISIQICALRSIFNILFSHCVWQCDCSDTVMQKGGCTWDQAISLHWVKLFQFRIQAFVPIAQHWKLETWHKQHYVL